MRFLKPVLWAAIVIMLLATLAAMVADWRVGIGYWAGGLYVWTLGLGTRTILRRALDGWEETLKTWGQEHADRFEGAAVQLWNQSKDKRQF